MSFSAFISALKLGGWWRARRFVCISCISAFVHIKKTFGDVPSNYRSERCSSDGKLMGDRRLTVCVSLCLCGSDVDSLIININILNSFLSLFFYFIRNAPSLIFFFFFKNKEKKDSFDRKPCANL